MQTNHIEIQRNSYKFLETLYVLIAAILMAYILAVKMQCLPELMAPLLQMIEKAYNVPKISLYQLLILIFY